jgi:hypothetical protein
VGSLLVTGCMRSGTHYTAGVLTGAGLVCTHEYLYRHDWDEPATKERGYPKLPDGWMGEASWLSAPFLDQIPQDVFVLHQVRHPLKVLRCIVHMGILSNTHETATQHVHRFLPVCGRGSDLFRGICYVLGWNALIEEWGRRNRHRYARWTVESLDLESFAWLTAHLRLPLALDNMRKSLEETPRNAATCGHVGEREWTWADVKDEPLRAMARRYGYED